MIAKWSHDDWDDNDQEEEEEEMWSEQGKTWFNLSNVGLQQRNGWWLGGGGKDFNMQDSTCL